MRPRQVALAALGAGLLALAPPAAAAPPPAEAAPVPMLQAIPAASPAQAWATVPGPAPGPARSIGGHGLGCIAGAEAMPAEGPGWQMVRLSRNRFWGHPALLASLRGLAARAQRAGLPALWIGDLGQPRGGPLPWGHASHQLGLDADIWFELNPKPPTTPAQREQIEVPSLVRPDGMDIDPRRYTPSHALLLRLAAEDPAVDRIFVNPAIKQAICRDHAGEPWLRRLRPWRGHDSHFHIRLRCLAGQAQCQDQAPVPAGDGCDASLAWWFSPEARQPPPPRPPGPPPRLPAACAGVLAAPG
ncbi:penicillin-insensitive murein endopeptidase [Pseudoroseomonas cervicalis]|uniref:penicillin-insensitive murein endopeptidase n=1 Tax=Teichococcus cervicalis TaxID=204525 RepID=UPI002785CEBD|nr:penicillin-insensitive murein endopeptidase [Pseudoroseomonas cervicalis]MDQ1079398.1 penicillin-insensitive murein endopeptidase [Pseudoroseomonas cervicalis]